MSLFLYAIFVSWKNETIHEWLKAGIPREKLVLGMSAYGRILKIKDQNDLCPSTGTPINGTIKMMFYQKEKGLISKNICVYVHILIDINI